jgi:hypothetical protein
MRAANVARVNRDVVAALAAPEMRCRLGDHGVDIVGNSPDGFGTMLEREAPRMAGARSRAAPKQRNTKAEHAAVKAGPATTTAAPRPG